MDDATKKIFMTLGATALKSLLLTMGTALAAHGVLSSGSQVEMFVAAGMWLAGGVWTFWNSYGRAIVLSQLEVWKARSLAQAAKLEAHNIPAPTNEQIAAQSPTVTAADVAKVTATLTSALLFACILVSSAYAQPDPRPAPRTRQPAPIQLPIDPLGLNKPAAATPALTGDLNKDVQAIWLKITTAATADLTYASAMASAAGTAASKTRKQCWDAILAANQQANGSALKNADGTTMVRPDPDLFTKVESLAEIIDNLSPQGTLYTSCAGAAQLAKMNVLAFINALVTGVAAFTATSL